MSRALRHAGLPSLVMLAPCLPYPPDRGDRLRWYHILRHLSQRYRVHLGCVTDPRCPPSHLSRLQALCWETCFVAPPALGRGNRPDPVLQAWIGRIRRQHEVQAVFACSARMAQYLPLAEGCVRVADYVDVESDKRRRREAQRSWPARSLGQRAARRQREDELRHAADADYLLFAAEPAAALFREQAPDLAPRVRSVANGVDADYFSPHILHRNPFGPGTRALVFAGAMDDWANAEAAQWFARRVFAPLRSADPALQFHIVGARPGAAVRALSRRSGIVVTGAVPDVRPYLAHAALVVAPLQAPHGLQNKVLEAMAMQQLVLATPAALAGLDVASGAEVLEVAEPGQFAGAVRAALRGGQRHQLGEAARARVLRDYKWQDRLASLDALLATPAPRRALAG